jgi:SAM-dependent methyltransferase
VTEAKQAAVVYKDGRLVYYRQQATAEHWDEVWREQDTAKLFEGAKRGELGYYEDIFPRHLPKLGKILEAGSGLGQIVIALRQRGYDAEGVDYAAETIGALNKEFPDQPFRAGDVTKLDVPDGQYSGYISLGVMEHDERGPQNFLREAHRVLRPGGVACISVPYFNFIRRLRAKLGLYPSRPPALPFYQYVFSKKEFSKLLDRAGFKIEKTYQYGGYKGVKDELPWISKLFDLPQGWRLRKWLMESKWINDHNGHMMLYVAERI